MYTYPYPQGLLELHVLAFLVSLCLLAVTLLYLVDPDWSIVIVAPLLGFLASVCLLTVTLLDFVGLAGTIVIVTTSVTTLVAALRLFDWSIDQLR